MDKSKLYYLVQKGTNNRAITYTKIPLIVEETAVDKVQADYSEKYEKISIEEFENKFGLVIGDGKSGKD